MTAERLPSPAIISYSYTLLHNRLIGLVHQLVEDATAGVTRGQADASVCALGAIVLADAVIEIAINHAVETGFPPRSMMPEHWPVHQFAFQQLGKTRPPLERLKALSIMRRQSPDWESEPWTSVRDLHTVRNTLMHYDSRPVQSNDPNVLTFPNEQKLRPIAARLGTLSLGDAGGTWLHLFLNPTAAKWAYDTAKAAKDLLKSDEWRRSVPFGPSDLARPDDR